MSACETEERIREALARHGRREIGVAGTRRAAVLLPLYRVGEEHFVLLTRRSEHVAHHKGQISCPGGAIDPEDSDPLAAALRETEEEVGIAPADVQVLGALDDVHTPVSGFVITPFVGLIPYPYPLQLNAREIDELVLVPLATFRDPGRLRVEERAGRPLPLLYYDCGQYEVWGATARIINSFINIVFGE
jgi:8-oxo-dGTP pyrophosphatase MutT (NUDIX family)